MYKAIALVGLSGLLSACIAVDEGDDVTNDDGDTVSSETLSLNGFWEGQLDQTSNIRLMVYQGQVFGLGDNLGYQGTITLDESSQTANLDLNGHVITANDETSLHYLADGVSTRFALEGLVYTTSVRSDTLVGDYESDNSAGSFLLYNDGTWGNNSSVGAVLGEWSAGVYSLYISSTGDRGSLRAISSTPGGCSFDGTIRPRNSDYNLYDVTITERKNCADFNTTNLDGYATITGDGDLEFFLEDTGLIYYMKYAAVAATADGGADDDDADAAEAG